MPGVWRYSSLVKETQSALANLYLILNLVVTIIVLSVAFVCGLLFNIYFTQRLPEIATLAAIGYPRALLIRRALGETAILCFFGWLLGGVLTIGLLEALKLLLFVPRGLLLNPLDSALLRLYTAPPIRHHTGRRAHHRAAPQSPRPRHHHRTPRLKPRF